MKKIILALALLVSLSLSAQTVMPDSLKPKVPNFPHWKKTIGAGLNFAAANFSNNWQGGGVSNIAVNAVLNATANYKSHDSILRWDNVLNLQYGVMKNKNQSLRKSNDLIFFDSKLSYQFHKAWNFFAGVNFLSQFGLGYTYGTDLQGLETRTRISSFMSPGYLTEAVGIEYKPAPYFSARLGLGATRQTFVLDPLVYNSIDTVRYGVAKGDKFRNELGFQVLVNFDKDLHKNINLKARYLGFFNYSDLSLNKMDHRFDIIITGKITKLINVNLTTVFLYDFDQIDTWQHSQAFALGIAYKF